jgi:hypothetical protein
VCVSLSLLSLALVSCSLSLDLIVFSQQLQADDNT